MLFIMSNKTLKYYILQLFFIQTLQFLLFKIKYLIRVINIQFQLYIYFNF